MKRSLRLTVLSAVCLCAAARYAIPAYAEEAKLTGWQTEKGKRYYYDAEGKKVTGTVKIEGISYVFAPNGAQQLGWQTVDGKRYFYNKKGEAVFGWLEWRGESYYISREDGKLTGRQTVDEVDVLNFDEFGVCSKWQTTDDGSWAYMGASGETEIDGELYLFTKDGILLTGAQKASDGLTRWYDAETHEILTGWITDENSKRIYADPEKGIITGWITDENGKRFYIDPEKGMLSGWQVIGGNQYKLLDTGEVFTGMYTVNGKTYLFGQDGIMVTGFAETDGGIRYFGQNGVMLTGLNTIGEDTYYFNADGIMQVGFQDVTTSDGKTLHCYFDSDGKRQTGWVTVGDKKYYLNPDGSVAATPTKIDGKTYLFDENGDIVKGWYTDSSGKKYYAGSDGVLVTGWQTISNTKYYFDANGVMAAAPTVIDGKTYNFNKDGTLTTGWITAADGTKRYAGADGVAVTGWQTIADVKYYFNANGVLATAPTTIDSKVYVFKTDGTLATGLFTAATGKKYFADANGVALTGWQELPTQSSYFGADGVMVVSSTVDGYTIDANGSARGNRAKTFDTIISNSDKTVNSVYQNFCAQYKYKEIEVARTTDQLITAGWDKLIDTVINRKGGVCYHLAASLDFTFKRAGFTSRVVYAWHNSHHYWVQVLIDGTWWNYDPTYGMQRCHITLAQQNQADINNGRPGYTLRGYVDATYDKKGALISAKYTPIS